MSPARIFGIAILVLAALIGIAAIVVNELREPPAVSGAVSKSSSVAIGGPFELVNQEGKRVTDADFRGQFMLIYFGYTYCPDVCPTELQDIASVMDDLGEEATKVTPVFITIDPARDGQEEVRAYVEAFHPRMVGLTGSEQQIAEVTKAYRVYYGKAPGGTGDDYLMDHSNFIYLMGPDGGNVAIFNGRTPYEEIAAGVREAVEQG